MVTKEARVRRFEKHYEKIFRFYRGEEVIIHYFNGHRRMEAVGAKFIAPSREKGRVVYKFIAYTQDNGLSIDPANLKLRDDREAGLRGFYASFVKFFKLKQQPEGAEKQ